MAVVAHAVTVVTVVTARVATAVVTWVTLKPRRAVPLATSSLSSVVASAVAVVVLLLRRKQTRSGKSHDQRQVKQFCQQASCLRRKEVMG